MTTPIDIRADHLRVVHDVLARHLPDGVMVWVFGNRAISSGSTFAEISKRAFRPLPVAVPPKTVLGVYGATSTSLHERTVSNTRVYALLGSLRDALLLKLVFGDVRIHRSERCHLASAI